MATPSTVQRTAETGDSFRTFDTGGIKSQAVAVVDENGNHTGVTGNAIEVNILSQTSGLTLDTTTPLDVQSAAETFVRYSTPEAAEDSKANIGTGACELRQLRVILDPTVTSVRYLMIFNSTTVPANATDPVWRMIVPIAGESSETFLKGEMAFTTGLSIALSATLDDLTVTTASEAYFQVVVAT